MNLQNDRFLFIDCQSTGAHPRHGHLLELAWCYASASDSAPKEMKCLLIKQPDGQTIPFRIQMITGITGDDMENAVAVNEAYDELQAQLRTICADETISGAMAVAHYASFERPFLADLFQRHGADNFPLELLCTYQIARRLFPDLPTRGIRGLGGYFGASDRDLKRSSHHVETTLSIWRGLVAELLKEGVTSVSDLQEWFKKPGRAKAGKYLFPLTAEKRLSLPQSPGIYKMLNKKGEVLYVGKATSLKSRVNSYFTGRKGKDSRKLEMATQTHDVAYIECGSALEAALLETDEIKKHNPPYNLSLQTRRRKLAFLSRDLFSVSDVQSDAHPIGPFSSTFVMDQFNRVFDWLSTGISDIDIFHGQVTEALIEEGFAMFCSLRNFDPAKIGAPRDLMAFSLRLLRNQSDEEIVAAYELEDEGGVDEDIDENNDESAIQRRTAAGASGEGDDEASLPQFTAEDVAGKFGRLFKRAAKAYVRGKILTRLLNCSVSFKERSRPRKLYITNGVVSSNVVSSSGVVPYSKGIGSHAGPASYSDFTPDSQIAMECKRALESEASAPWAGHEISTYDRLSVLLGEIVRLSHADTVDMQPPVPLHLVSRVVV